MQRPKIDEVHLWYQDLNSPGLELLAETRLDLLTSQERETCKGFASAWKRQEYWAARVLTRTVLSGYLSVPFETLKFTENAHGRPEISYPRSARSLSFNVSHCRGLLVCAVGSGCELGVDAEVVKETENLLGVAKSHFSESEFADLQDSSPERRLKRFFEYWTLKEAYVKARGAGMAIPLQDFAFNLGADGSIAFSAGPGLGPDKGWWFKLDLPLKGCQVALAVRNESVAAFKVTERWNLLTESKSLVSDAA